MVYFCHDSSKCFTLKNFTNQLNKMSVKIVYQQTGTNESKSYSFKDREILMKSGLFKEMLEEGEEGGGEEIPVQYEASIEMMDLIIWFMSYHTIDPMPEVDKTIIRNKPMTQNCSEWDTNFIENHFKTLKERKALFQAADYLDIEDLKELAACSIAYKLIQPIRDEDVEKMIREEMV